VRLGDDLRLRDASASDAEFIYRVIERTMRGYVEKTWGTFNEEGNRRHVAAAIAAREFALIQRDGEDVGALSVERRPEAVWLSQLFVLPEHQNKGIGSRIVRALIAEAADSRKPLRLRVLAVNPARQLYGRLGFRVFTATPGRIYMQRLPSGIDAPSDDCPPAVCALLDTCGITADMVAMRFLPFQPEAGELVVAEVDDSGREHRLAPAAAAAWREMRAAADAEGVPIRIVSAFRGIERQAEIVRAKLARGIPLDDILKSSAPPGYSEHHSGLAVDLTTDGVRALEGEFEGTRAYEWLRENAGRFGFRLSFPRGNACGYAYEPWHWRFAGGD
jgi:zinc D-Ala-D-Ala carboxypeptidase